jgi:hypothetical protein
MVDLSALSPEERADILKDIEPESAKDDGSEN